MDFEVKAILLLCLLLTPAWVTAQDMMVNPTLLSHEGAVCLSGIQAAYYFVPGTDEGANNWLVYLPGGGWCSTPQDCQNYISIFHINQPAKPIQFKGILSTDSELNPDFFNWNKVVIRYCDGSSFTGNSTLMYNGNTLNFKGAKIFQSAMVEMAEKGMKSAKKALLVGESAGGVAVMLHCDEFSNSFNSMTHVKCLSDSGYFFPAKRHNNGSKSPFLSTFEGLVTLQRSAEVLPNYCTSKLSAAMCFFAQNVQEGIKTPIFFLMAEYDDFEIGFTTGSRQSYITCFNSGNCTSDQVKIMQDFRLEFLNVVSKLNNYSSRGFLFMSCFGHGHVTRSEWYQPTAGTNQTMSKLFGDWYNDRRIVQVIDKGDNPYKCD